MKTVFPCENANSGKSCFNYRKSCFHYRNVTNYASTFSGDESVDQALKKLNFSATFFNSYKMSSYLTFLKEKTDRERERLR